MNRICLFLMILFMHDSVLAEKVNYYLVEYSPGPHWSQFEDQDRSKMHDAHKAYLQNLYQANVLVMSGALETSGRSVLVQREYTLADARKHVDRDPAVESQMLKVELNTWFVDLSAIRIVKNRLPNLDPDEPFTLERLDPEALITLKKN